MNHDDLLTLAGTVFRGQIDALRASETKLGARYVDAAMAIFRCAGKVVTMGIGKSGLIARKIAATMSSTGTQAVFVHPVECLHGDMGIIDARDLALILSKSGESDEIRKLVMFLRNRKIPIIAITACVNSHLAHSADIVLEIDIPNEGCPMEMVPMASSTVSMVVGDVLASMLIKLRDFKPDDFALFHPAGSIGKRLLLKVEDLMHSGDAVPVVPCDAPMRDVLVVMTEKAMGAVLVVRDAGKLAGILTDGDLRRALQKYEKLVDYPVERIMTRDPVAVAPGMKAIEALRLMENRSSQISVLPVIDVHRAVCGILRLHDLVIAGL